MPYASLAWLNIAAARSSGRDPASLHTGGKEENDAKDHPAHKHDAGCFAHVNRVVGDKQQHEDHGGHNGENAPMAIPPGIL